MLSRWLYPLLKNLNIPNTATRMFTALSGDPTYHVLRLAWIAAGGAEYQMLLCLPSSPVAVPHTLLINMLLVLVNLKASASYRTLVASLQPTLALVAVLSGLLILIRKANAPARAWTPQAAIWANCLLDHYQCALALHPGPTMKRPKEIK